MKEEIWYIFNDLLIIRVFLDISHEQKSVLNVIATAWMLIKDLNIVV